MTSRLERFPFVKQMSAQASGRLFGGLQEHAVDAKKPLVQRGDRVGGAYLVEEGDLRVYHISAAGRESTLYWVTPGESCILAMNCLFSDLRYPAWVESGEEGVRFAVVPSALYRELFATEPAVQSFTFSVLAGRIFELMTMLGEAVSLDMEQRVASFLVSMCDDSGSVAMSQERIASHLGTAREVVSRVLRKLAARGVLRTNRGTVTVLDAPALAALVRE